MPKIEVKVVNGHYELYADGEFAGSADTYGEVAELEKYTTADYSEYVDI